MGTITSICYRPLDAEKHPPTHFNRIRTEQARLVANYGIEGDAKGGHPKRQVNVIDQQTLDELHARGYQIEPGQMGEQIIIEGLDLKTLKSGDHLQLGDSARIEVMEQRTGCERFENIQHKPNPTTDQKGTLGIMARVIQSGDIHTGDRIQIVTSPEVV